LSLFLFVYQLSPYLFPLCITTSPPTTSPPVVFAVTDLPSVLINLDPSCYDHFCRYDVTASPRVVFATTDASDISSSSSSSSFVCSTATTIRVVLVIHLPLTIFVANDDDLTTVIFPKLVKDYQNQSRRHGNQLNYRVVVITMELVPATIPIVLLLLVDDVYK